MYFKRDFTLLSVLLWGAIASAQYQPDKSSFYRSRAISDAGYEHGVHFRYEKDELDYWKDQRNFENTLRDSDPEGYYFYLRYKRDEYDAHKKVCSTSCNHGDYYFLQASFYIQNGGTNRGIQTSADRIDAVSSIDRLRLKL